MNEARINRYNLLTNYCRKKNILHLFVGHHLDDNLETFIYRKVSGSDFEGLQSIKNKSVNNKVDVKFNEGILKIEIDKNDNIFMTGPVSEIKNIKIEI